MILYFPLSNPSAIPCGKSRLFHYVFLDNNILSELRVSKDLFSCNSKPELVRGISKIAYLASGKLENREFVIHQTLLREYNKGKSSQSSVDLRAFNFKSFVYGGINNNNYSETHISFIIKMLELTREVCSSVGLSSCDLNSDRKTILEKISGTFGVCPVSARTELYRIYRNSYCKTPIPRKGRSQARIKSLKSSILDSCLDDDMELMERMYRLYLLSVVYGELKGEKNFPAMKRKKGSSSRHIISIINDFSYIYQSAFSSLHTGISSVLITNDKGLAYRANIIFNVFDVRAVAHGLDVESSLAAAEANPDSEEELSKLYWDEGIWKKSQP